MKKKLTHSLFWLGGLTIAILLILTLDQNLLTTTTLAIKYGLIGATIGGSLWHLAQRNQPFQKIITVWRTPIPIHYNWFLLSLVLYTYQNHLILKNLSLSTTETISIVTGRTLTAILYLSFYWIGAHLASLSAPRSLRLIPWVIPALIPGILATNAFTILTWKNSLRILLHKIDEDGPLDLALQISAAGIHQSLSFVITLIISIALTLLFFSYLAHRFTKKITLTHKFALITLTLTWGLLNLEKAIGLTWKSRTALRMEQNLYDIHLTSIESDLSLVSYQVTWHKPTPPTPKPRTDKTPDIYFIMIESVRNDAIRPAHTPFLASFRDQECQPIQKTWSASNATHLSWFSIFNGQIPHRWEDAITTVREGQPLPPAPFFKLLQKLNYRLEGRTVCDLNYVGMETTNFGSPHQFDLLKSAPPESDFAKLPLSTRETQNREEAQASILAHPEGGNFHFLAYDSPHFEYNWPDHFTPPYSDYAKAGEFHPYPSSRDIELVRNRYLNALAWTDYEISRFITFLKEHNRYQNALIIITGDHGEEFQENGSWFHCSTVAPEQTSVPLMIKWPLDTSAPPQASASHLDILPSLFDYFESPTFAELPGKSLLQQHQKTEVVMTSFCGVMGCAMAWHRDGYTATFRWYQPWKTILPDTISLDNITGPNGPLDYATPAEWDQALRKHFPDAFERYFEKITPTQ